MYAPCTTTARVHMLASCYIAHIHMLFSQHIACVYLQKLQKLKSCKEFDGIDRLLEVSQQIHLL